LSIRKTTILEDQIIKKISIRLPGGNKQLEHLFEQNIPQGIHALIIGPGCEFVAIQLGKYNPDINIIADDSDSVMQIRMNLKDEDRIKVKMMDYAKTDFEDGFFDLIYAQASISISNKKEIVKELKRILSVQGILCAGEIVSLKKPVPEFVKDIWERSGLEPIDSKEIINFYESKGFKCLSEKDLSAALKDYYEKIMLEISKVSKNEKEADKKYFSRMKHESNAYLKLGGDKYIGFKSMIFRKSK
jgi:ubiquinone/menaquinone biosynthesis C-methylase UbiE